MAVFPAHIPLATPGFNRTERGNEGGGQVAVGPGEMDRHLEQMIQFTSVGGGVGEGRKISFLLETFYNVCLICLDPLCCFVFGIMGSFVMDIY